MLGVGNLYVVCSLQHRCTQLAYKVTVNFLSMQIGTRGRQGNCIKMDSTWVVVWIIIDANYR